MNWVIFARAGGTSVCCQITNNSLQSLIRLCALMFKKYLSRSRLSIVLGNLVIPGIYTSCLTDCRCSSLSELNADNESFPRIVMYRTIFLNVLILMFYHRSLLDFINGTVSDIAQSTSLVVGCPWKWQNIKNDFNLKLNFSSIPWNISGYVVLRNKICDSNCGVATNTRVTKFPF